MCQSGELHRMKEYTAAYCTRIFSAGHPEIQAQLVSEIITTWGGDRAAFFRCKHCSFMFAWPFKPGSAAFYSLAYAHQESYVDWKWDFEVSRHSIKTMVTDPQNATLLEIGAGTGAFVGKIKEIIPPANILCTEYSDFGRRTINDMGITCVAAGVDELSRHAGDRKFDLVCMFQVLEHMDKPDVVFEIIHRMTNPEAQVFITVPNDEHRAFYDSLGDYMDLPPTHISRWTYQSLERLVSRYGWTIAEHRRSPASWLSKYRDLLFNRAQNLGNYSRLNAIRPAHLRKLTFAIIFLYFTIRYSPFVVRLTFRPLGVSQWFRLVKGTVKAGPETRN